MAHLLPAGLRDCLLWSDELGMGYHPRRPISYDGDYWAEYEQRDATPMGIELTAARASLVRRHYLTRALGDLVDIGIGAGAFVKRAGCCGYDVNPVARQWLRDNGRWRDPSDPATPVQALTFWDSLEHIPVPELAVANARQWVFVSMPIYKDQADCLRSPHFKPGEHLWYWTEAGLILWFRRQGFDVAEVNRDETLIGRRGILSFAFRRLEPQP